MLYVFEVDGQVRVGSVDPATDDFDKILSESFVATLDNSKWMSIETHSCIVRNVVSAGLTIDRVLLK